MSKIQMEEESNLEQDQDSGSQPIDEYLFIEKDESSSASNDDSDDDSAHSSDEECFRPTTPIEEIEKEEKEKKQAPQKDPQQIEFANQKTKSATENQPQRKKASQPSTCCLLI